MFTIDDIKRHREQWIKELRSGHYLQAQGALSNRQQPQESYCCLGVACNIIDPDAWDFDGGWRSGQPKGGTDTSFPLAMQEYFGLDEEDCSALAGMNDEGESFEHIADTIEKLGVE